MNPVKWNPRLFLLTEGSMVRIFPVLQGPFSPGFCVFSEGERNRSPLLCSASYAAFLPSISAEYTANSRDRIVLLAHPNALKLSLVFGTRPPFELVIV